MLMSSIGILANISLFMMKFFIGVIVNSISIRADAINNLSDAGSSFISFVSFKLASKPADEDHPFGHARYEAIASFLVATLILMLGFDLLQSSVMTIFSPKEVQFSIVSIGILLLSIFIKFWMYCYNKKYGKLLKASVMEATAMDSLSDVMATAAVLASTLLSYFFHLPLDGYMGVVVAIFILKAGAEVIRNALDELLGKAPDPSFIKQLEEKIMSYEGVLGMHDLIVHNYGPQRTFASVHVEVDGHKDIFSSHDIVDNIERDFQKEFHMSLVVHMDPINTDDELTNELKGFTEGIVQQVDHCLSIHDFRIVSGDTHTNLIFDITVPHHIKDSNTQLQKKIQTLVHEKYPTYYVVITFDRAY
ncbi:MAG: cation diffusion facilitator family transporter, partial [Erysipelotrichaceae bacterium]|nr:cation diffusion facilitator family transporter [Erysipelotrichaceae bacterium]